MYINMISKILKPVKINLFAIIFLWFSSHFQVIAQSYAIRAVESEPIDQKNIHIPRRFIELEKNGIPRDMYVISDRAVSAESTSPLFDILRLAKFTNAKQLNYRQIDALRSGIIIMVGKNESALYNRLVYNDLITPAWRPFRLRIIPKPFQKNIDVIVIEGTNSSELMQTYALLQAALMKNANKIRSGIFPLQKSEKIQENKKNYYAIYENISLNSHNAWALMKMYDIAIDYNNTGDENVAQLFFECAEDFHKRFKAIKKFDWTDDFPGFYFNLIAMGLNLVERSDAATPEKLTIAIDALRLMCEECFNHDNMDTAAAVYSAQNLQFLYNHPLEASRCLGICADYILGRYPDNHAAQYWQALADFVLQGPLLSSQSFEDGATYQWTTYQCTFLYVLVTGRLRNVFTEKKSILRELSDWYIMHFTHLAHAPAYGDMYIPGNTYTNFGRMLSEAIPENQELRYIWQIPQKTPWESRGFNDLEWEYSGKLPISHTGLRSFPCSSFILSYHSMEGIFNKPLLNKACFRSGWTMNDEELYLSGKNVGTHGHFDANAIIHYSRGPYYWFADGRYIGSQPIYHNTMILEYNGESTDYHGKRAFTAKGRTNAFATIDGEICSDDRKTAILQTTLHEYCGMDWTRTIVWQALNGFFIIDRVSALNKGMYYIKNRLQLIGSDTLDGSRVVMRQKKAAGFTAPNVLTLENAEEIIPRITQRFDAGQGGGKGYFREYLFSEDPYTRVVDYIKKRGMNKNEQEWFVTLISHHDDKNSPKPVLKKISSNVFCAMLPEPYCVIIGNYKSPDIEITAELAQINTRNICALQATSIRIGDLIWKGAASNITLSAEKQGKLIKNFFSGSLPESQTIRNSPLRDTFQKFALSGFSKIQFSNAISAAAVSSEKILLADTNGVLTWIDPRGKTLHSTKIKAIPTASCTAVDGMEETIWLVGCRPEKEFENLKEGVTELLFCFTDKGLIKWTQKIPPYSRRLGAVVNICSFTNSDHASVIIVGCENWHYYAYSADGVQLWNKQVYHSATASLAQDLDGDGSQDIILGDEYQVFYCMDENGDLKKSFYHASIGDITTITPTPNGNGTDFVFSKSDGWLRGYNLVNNNCTWEANVGGNITCAVVSPSKTIIVGTENDSLQTFDMSGKRGAQVFFSDEVCALSCTEEQLYVLCRNGAFYELDEDMEQRNVYQISENKEPLVVPGSIMFDNEISIFWYGKTVLLKQR